MDELLEKIPTEERWAITAKILTRISVLRGSKTMPSVLGKEIGILAPVWGWEKWVEILVKIYSDLGQKMLPWFLEILNIPVEDTIRAAKLSIVAWTLFSGPEVEAEIIEATPERAVVSITKCSWWERFKELDVNPELRGACNACEVWCEDGLKAINPKISYKLMKTSARGDPYCEAVIELKDV